MKLIITCPGCQKRFTVDGDGVVGKRATCKGCKAAFIVDPGNYKELPSMAEELMHRATITPVVSAATELAETTAPTNEPKNETESELKPTEAPTSTTTLANPKASAIKGILITTVIALIAIPLVMKRETLDTPAFLGVAFCVCLLTCVSLAFFVGRLFPRVNVIAFVGLVAFSFYLTFQVYDWSHFEMKWTNEYGTYFIDTYRRRDAKIVYRRAIGKDYKWRAEGAFSLSGKPHGRWENDGDEPYSDKPEWYWYGEKVTEGDFHLRSK